MMRRRPFRFRLLASALPAAVAACLLASGLLAPAPARAQSQENLTQPGERAVITADEMTHDKELQTVTARGGVEIDYAGRTLRADTVSYQMAKDMASASGNVVLVDTDGTTMFSDYAELTGELKDGFAREIRIRLTDGSIAAAREARRTGGNRTEMDYGVYSPCDACNAEGDRLWQVKAVRVVHDQQERQITYRDAWLEVAGVPVAYTPYLSHPDPTVKRRSGFLAPSIARSPSLGMTMEVPYYLVIDDQQDLTITPQIAVEDNPALAVEYRGLGHDARIAAEVSGTYTRDGRFRNHVNAEMLASLDDTWRAGADVALTSDRSYLKTYRDLSPSFLTTRPYLQGFGRRSHAIVEGYYFQSMRAPTTITESAPVVLPLAEWNYVSAPGERGGYHTFDTGFAAVSREGDGTDSRRLSAEYGWHLPYIGPIGDVYRLDVSVRGDAYHVADVDTPDGSYTGTTGRIVPQAALTWSWPMMRSHEGWSEVIEPIVQGVVAPRGQNPEDIPNEDSLDFEFDDTNLFSTNRFTGWDRVEGGARVNYGLRYGAFIPGTGRLEMMGGQSWTPAPEGLFTDASGLAQEFSDYVGRIGLEAGPNLGLLYRFRLDKDTLQANRYELAARVGPPALQVGVSYIGLVGETLRSSGQATEREEVTVGVSSRFSRYWRARAVAQWEMADEVEPLLIGGGLGYEDECLAVDFTAERRYTYDEELESGLYVGLRVLFKTLGETTIGN